MTTPRKLRLADELSVPIELAQQTVGILGIRGSGKTNTAGVIAEELLSAGVPICVLDPTDAWWGLRSTADGKAAGFPVFIFGGEHGDLPLAETDGKVIAVFLVAKQVPIVLSLRHLRKAAQRRFVADFLEELYHLKGKAANRSPLAVFLDEAPLFVPQKVTPDAARTTGAVEDLIARGRNAGFGVVLISQRSATINKDVLTQCDTLISHRLPSPQDRKALLEWFEHNVTSDEYKTILASLPSLKNGEAWVWAPPLKIMQRTQMRMRATFDSSKTPEFGARFVEPKNLAAVDIAQLKEELRSTVERAREADPKLLKGEIERLKQELAKQPEVSPANDALMEQLQRERDEARRDASRAKHLAEELNDLVWQASEASAENFASLRRSLEQIEQEMPKVEVRPAAAIVHPVQKAVTAQPRMVNGSGEAMGKAERAILTALAQLGESSKERVAAFTGYAVNGGGFNNALSRLRTLRLIEGSGSLSLTKDFREAISA